MLVHGGCMRLHTQLTACLIPGLENPLWSMNGRHSSGAQLGRFTNRSYSVHCLCRYTLNKARCRSWLVMALLASQLLGVATGHSLGAGSSACQPVQCSRARLCSCAAPSSARCLVLAASARSATQRMDFTANLGASNTQCVTLPVACNAAAVDSSLAPSTSQPVHILTPCAAGRLIYNGTVSWVQ